MQRHDAWRKRGDRGRGESMYLSIIKKGIDGERSMYKYVLRVVLEYGTIRMCASTVSIPTPHPL